MNDSISRRAAVDAFMTILDKPNHAEFLYTDEICKVLNNLPSEQPDITYCKDCKYVERARSEKAARKFGQIYICGRHVFSCPEPYDFCSRAERWEE